MADSAAVVALAAAEPMHKPALSNTEKSENRLLAEQLKSTGLWLHGAVDGHYSIQLFMARTSEANRIEAFLRNAPETLDFTEIYIYETGINGRNWYSVVYGDFDTQSGAIESLDRLPVSLKTSGAYLRRISALKKDNVRNHIVSAQ